MQSLLLQNKLASLFETEFATYFSTLIYMPVFSMLSKQPGDNSLLFPFRLAYQNPREDGPGSHPDKHDDFKSVAQEVERLSIKIRNPWVP